MARWREGRLRVGGVFEENSTASLARFVLAQRGPRPSRTTIAPATPLLQGVAAPSAISHETRNGDDTQPWPECQTRTKAPCHTRTAFPPGSPTRALHRKALPEGRASEHEDENGVAA